ncbi:MAG: hypothetical protein AB4426_02960 [Xenococcaceae cyanobacterium]
MMSAVVGLMGLTLPAKPLLAHSGHHQNTSKPEPPQQHSEHHNEMHQEIEERPETSTSPTAEVSPVSEVSTITPSAISSNQLSLIPQPAELVFFLLVTSPFLLYSIKKRMYHNE